MVELSYKMEYVHMCIRWCCSKNELIAIGVMVCVQVIARIFYTVNRSWSGKITIPELRRSNFLQVCVIHVVAQEIGYD